MENDTTEFQMDNYQKLAQRTAPNHDQKMLQRARRSEFPIDLDHAITGLVGEVGEIADAQKRFIFYGEPFDEDNFKEEIGDLLWYIALYCEALNYPMEEGMKANIDKLKKRYPGKFTEQDAIERKDKASET